MKTVISILKIVFLILFNFSVFYLKNPIVFLILNIFLSLLLYFTRQKYFTLRRLIPLFFIGVSIVVFQLVFNGTILWQERIMLGYLTASRIIVLSLGMIVFISITSASEIMRGLFFLPKSLKLLLVLTFSFIPLIFDESEKITLAQKSRGLKSRYLSIREVTAKTIPLFHRVFQRSQALALTIVARGYSI